MAISRKGHAVKKFLKELTVETITRTCVKNLI